MPTNWREATRAAAVRAGIDPDVFEAQIGQESSFDPTARSGAGAVGIAQIVPQYHPGVDPTDPEASLAYAATWMRDLVRQYGGDYRRALVHYNGGGGAVARYEAGQPYEESQAYLTAILPQGGPKVRAQVTEASLDDQQQGIPADAFRAFVAKHGGLAGHEILDKPTEDELDSDGIKTGGKKPLTVSPRIRYVFNDGTKIVARQLDDGQFEITDPGTAKPPGADKPAAAPAHITGPDGNIYVADPDNPGRFVPASGIPTRQPTPPVKAPGTILSGTSPADSHITILNPDGSLTRTPNPDYKPETTKAERATIGNRIVERQPDGTWKQVFDAGREPRDPDVIAANNASTAASNANTNRTNTLLPYEVRKAEQGLMPAQQQAIQGHLQTIQYVQGMLERGEMSPSDADAYIDASKKNAAAALRGTTLFDEAKEKRQAEDARRSAGTTLLTNRLTSGSSLASSLVSSVLSAAGNAHFAPGQTSLGLDPMALARQYTDDLSGGPEMGTFAQGLITGASQGAQPAPGGYPQPIATSPGDMPPGAQQIPPPPWLPPAPRMPGAAVAA